MVTRSRPLWPRLIAALIGLPVLYVLSIGPAASLCDKGFISKENFEFFYAPVLTMLSHAPIWVTIPYLYYLRFWGVAGIS